MFVQNDSVHCKAFEEHTKNASICTSFAYIQSLGS